MFTHNVVLLHGILALLVDFHAEPIARAQGPPPSQKDIVHKGAEALTRGPIQEAFAIPSTVNPRPNSILSQKPPAAGLERLVTVAVFDIKQKKTVREGADHKYQEQFAKCAKICLLCQLECDACFHHCAQQAGDGATEHARSMRLCLDCAELCSTAARLTARHSPLSAAACEACARGCDLCATSCEAIGADKSMAACAKACRQCADACRELMKSASRSP